MATQHNTNYGLRKPEQLLRELLSLKGKISTPKILVQRSPRNAKQQQEVYDQKAAAKGQEYADSYVQKPGFSEHHTGLAVDVGIFYSDGSQGSFSESRNAVWIPASPGRIIS